MLKRYNKPGITILALASFLFLAQYSWDQPQDYTQHQVDSMTRLVSRVSNPKAMTEANARKMRYLYE